MLELGTLIRYGSIGLCFVIAGCATLRNTPKQDYAWSCIEACRTEIPPQCQVVSVDTEGRLSGLCTSGSLANWNTFDGCLQKQYKERPYSVWLKQRAR